ncbi:MAG: sulfotransferase family protein [Reichenbachiella sp.]
MVINLIATPRNVSTALMYSFAQHSSVKVIDEPFYAYYLALSEVDHPGKDTVMKELPQNMNAVLALIKKVKEDHEIVFVKNMAHHLLEVHEFTFSKFKNVFLTRDPKELIASFCKVIEKPTIEDIGVKSQWLRFEALLNKGHAPVIIDSGYLLKDPKAYLSLICETIEMPFEESMLSWEKGPIAEDGSWAKYWYKTVHDSTCFANKIKEEVVLTEHGQTLYEEALPYYEKLSEYTLKL